MLDAIQIAANEFWFPLLMAILGFTVGIAVHGCDFLMTMMGFLDHLVRYGLVRYGEVLTGVLG